MRRFWAFSLMLILLSPPVSAEEAPKAEAKVQADAQTDSDWTLGISEIPLAAGPLASTERAALAGLPALVLEKIHDLEFRFVPEAEQTARSERTRLAALYSGGAAAASARDKRDAAALSPSPAQKRLSEGRSLREEYEKKAIRSIPEKSGDAGAKEVSKIALWKGHASGRFLAPTDDPETVCAKESLDYLIRWQVQESASFLRIRMEGWNGALGRADFSHVAYCSADDVASVSEELAAAVILAAVAKPSARVVFRPDPVECRIYVDDRLVEASRGSIRVYEERDYRVRAWAEGYEASEVTVHPAFGKDSEAALRLVPREAGTITVSSAPAGASLYLNGIWVGETPIEIPAYGKSRVAILTYPGFEKLFGVLAPGNAEAGASFALYETKDGTATVFSRRKDSFYKSLGLFVVSIPVSIVTYGMYLENAFLYAEYPNNSTFSRRNDVWFGCFAAATGVTVVLAVNAVIHLVRYVKSAR